MPSLSSEMMNKLVTRVIGGDNEGWGELYSAYYNAIKGHCKTFVAENADAEDLTEEIFMRALENIDQYDPKKGTFYTFLLLIARNVRKRNWKLKGKLIQVADMGGAGMQGEGDESTDRLTWAEPSQDAFVVRLELLDLLMNRSSKPHHIIACLFVKFLEWKPHEVARELSNWTLKSLADKAYEDYFASMTPLKQRGRAYWQPLFDKLTRMVNDLYIEPEYSDLRTTCFAKKVGALALKCFFGRGQRTPSESMSDWCDRTKISVKKALEGD